MRLLDWPPVWTLACIIIIVVSDRVFPAIGLNLEILRIAALGLFGFGLTITVMAAAQMMRRQTTLIPRQQPEKLVNTGIFRFSRNPIYLGDLCFVAATALWTGFWPGLVLVWGLKRVLERRFIFGEEKSLEATFGQEYANWANLTRRWM